jgi:hypothetical protein
MTNNLLNTSTLWEVWKPRPVLRSITVWLCLEFLPCPIVRAAEWMAYHVRRSHRLAHVNQVSKLLWSEVALRDSISPLECILPKCHTFHPAPTPSQTEFLNCGPSPPARSVSNLKAISPLRSPCLSPPCQSHLDVYKRASLRPKTYDRRTDHRWRPLPNACGKRECLLFGPCLPFSA